MTTTIDLPHSTPMSKSDFPRSLTDKTLTKNIWWWKSPCWNTLPLWKNQMGGRWMRMPSSDSLGWGQTTAQLWVEQLQAGVQSQAHGAANCIQSCWANCGRQKMPCLFISSVATLVHSTTFFLLNDTLASQLVSRIPFLTPYDSPSTQQPESSFKIR